MIQHAQNTGLFSFFPDKRRNLQVAKIIENKTNILDIGCGSASLLRTLYKLGKQDVLYWGIDIFEKVIEQNRKNYPEYIFSCINIITDDLSAIQGIFDVITMIAVIEHIKCPSSVISKLLPFLSPHGRIIITTPLQGTEKIYNWCSQIGIFSREANEEHNDVFFNKKELESIAYSAGLTVQLYKRFLMGYNQLIVFSR